ncbi:MAG: hypothetical protein JO115_12930 [Pseudonocardiales bacterium]|nr:hypothetical protein [Pseudonocardiales bacterium]
MTSATLMSQRCPIFIYPPDVRHSDLDVLISRPGDPVLCQQLVDATDWFLI